MLNRGNSGIGGVLQNTKLMVALLTLVLLLAIFVYEAMTNKDVSDELSRDLNKLEHSFDHAAAPAGVAEPKHETEQVKNYALTLFLAFIAGAISAAGGIGGGGVLVPLYILVAPMTAHGAPLSLVFSFRSALQHSDIPCMISAVT